MNNIDKLENWTEVEHGFYRYVIAAKACYEILVLCQGHETPTETAKASLFITGFWQSDQGRNSVFERECLLAEQPVFECVVAAAKDYRENC